MFKRYRIIVSGRVQGVSFRDYARKCAMVWEVKGWVKNLPNGNVEIVAEGKDSGIKEFVTKLKIGSGNANVENVSIEEDTFKDEFQKFEIIQ